MKTALFPSLLSLAAAAVALVALPNAEGAQVIVTSFDTSASTNGWYYQNWNNSVGVFSWAAGPAADAGSSANSGSLEMRTVFGGTNNGGAYRLPVNDLNGSAYTALEYDAKVDPNSPLDKYGGASDFKVGVFTTSAYNYHALDYNLAPVSTNNGWQHFVVPASSIGGTEWGDIKEVFIQQYDNNYTNAATAINYIDNIKFTGPDPTYPNFVSPTLQFNDPTSVGAINNNYGSPVTFSWSTNDAKGLTNSGSLYVVASFQPSANNDVLFIPFDTNYVIEYTGPYTNLFINGRQYTNIEFDVMWDTANSTIPLSEFNSAGDIGGFPLGLLCNTATADQGQEEACGSAAAPIPDAATNGWVHMSCAINQNQANIDQTVGLWLKKYAVASFTAGTAAYWVDNFVFDGARIARPVPTMTLSKAAPGLQINFTGTGNNPPYDRENLVTAASTYSFVDSSGPVTYSLTYGEFAPSSYSLAGQITFVPTSTGASGTETEPDWVDSTVFKISLSRNGLGSQVTLLAKTNAPNDNGSLYVAGNPAWVTPSHIEGKWSFTITGNTNIQAVAPDGSSTNLVFPLGLNAAGVSSLFSGGAFVYFGGECGGSAGEGGRVVIQNISISGGSATPLSDNFLADTNLDLVNNGGTLWNNATDTSVRPDGVYLLSAPASWLDWTVNGGTGWLIETSGDLAKGNWSTNVPWATVLDASHFHADLTNPPTGNLFFRLFRSQ
jgi:hypothetical protein